MSSVVVAEVINVGDVVFAKQKGHPWWLAKVIELTKSKELAKKVFKIRFYKSKNEIYVGRKRIETLNKHKTADGNVCFKGKIFNMNEVCKDFEDFDVTNPTEPPTVVLSLEKPSIDETKTNQQFTEPSLNSIPVTETQTYPASSSLQISASEGRISNSEAICNLQKSVCELVDLQNNFNETITKQTRLLKTVRVGLEQVESLDLKEEIDEINEIFKKIQRKLGDVTGNSLKRKSEDCSVFIPHKKPFFAGVNDLTEMKKNNMTAAEMHLQNPVSRPCYQQNHISQEINQPNQQSQRIFQPNSTSTEIYQTNSYPSVSSNAGMILESDEDGIRRAIFDTEKLLSRKSRNDEAVFDQIGQILNLLNRCNSKSLTEGVLRLMKLIQMWKPSPKTLSRCKECFYLYCKRFYIQNGTEKINLHENDVLGRVQMVFKVLSTCIPNIDEAVRIIKGIKISQLINLNNSAKMQCRDILLMISKFSFYDNIAVDSKQLLAAYI